MPKEIVYVYWYYLLFNMYVLNFVSVFELKFSKFFCTVHPILFLFFTFHFFICFKTIIQSFAPLESSWIKQITAMSVVVFFYTSVEERKYYLPLSELTRK